MNDLTPEQKHILDEEGTEIPGSSPLNHEKREGMYVCAKCGAPLFTSETKYESGSGWPSFYQPVEGSLETKTDMKIGVPRTEYHCRVCGGHQGHVFEDGPQPTGLRYCNNGLSLEFIPKDSTDDN
jgi:peptide-methionine (R)-S-oxide reductase